MKLSHSQEAKEEKEEMRVNLMISDLHSQNDQIIKLKKKRREREVWIGEGGHWHWNHAEKEERGETAVKGTTQRVEGGGCFPFPRCFCTILIIGLFFILLSGLFFF
ncbi:hypothetical protein Dimus_017891 [Dionaea muscipula]